MTRGSRRRGIYLLPSLLTTAAMFAGFAAILFADEGRFPLAALAVFLGIALDALDGRVARLTRTASEFGLHYDSLSDLVTFGVAPALVLYQWSLQHVAPFGGDWARLGWLAAFFYLAAVGLRLARFNALAAAQDRAFFRGLPSPAAAGLLMAGLWVAERNGYAGADLRFWALAAALAAAVLMVSRFSYYSFKDLGPRRLRLATWLAVLAGLLLLAWNPPLLLLLAFFLYALSGPALFLLQRWRRAGRRGGEERDGPGPGRAGP